MLSALLCGANKGIVSRLLSLSLMSLLVFKCLSVELTSSNFNDIGSKTKLTYRPSNTFSKLFRDPTSFRSLGESPGLRRGLSVNELIGRDVQNVNDAWTSSSSRKLVNVRIAKESSRNDDDRDKNNDDSHGDDDSNIESGDDDVKDDKNTPSHHNNKKSKSETMDTEVMDDVDLEDMSNSSDDSVDDTVTTTTDHTSNSDGNSIEGVETVTTEEPEHLQSANENISLTSNSTGTTSENLNHSKSEGYSEGSTLEVGQEMFHISQEKFCENLQSGIVDQKTSIGMSFIYQYDLKLKIPANQAINFKDLNSETDPLNLAGTISESIQQFLTDLYARPHCERYSTHAEGSVANGDFRLLEETNFTNATANMSPLFDFPEHIRGIGIGPSTLIKINKTDINSISYRLESVNLIYLDEKIVQNDSMINDTYIRETILQAILKSFKNQTVIMYFNLISGATASIDVSFVNGKSGDVQVSDGTAQYSDQNEENGEPSPLSSGESFKTQSDNPNNNGLVVAVSLMSVTIVLLGGFIWYSKKHIDQPHRIVTSVSSQLSSNQDSTIALSIRTNGSKVAISAVKAGTDKMKRGARSASLAIKENVNFIKFLIEKWSNKRKGRLVLEDDDYITRFKIHPREIALNRNDTLEFAGTASFDDEMGMEMILQQLELESCESGGRYSVLDKSLLFDKDVFANVTYNSFDAIGDQTTTSHDSIVIADSPKEACHVSHKSPIELQHGSPSSKTVILIQETKVCNSLQYNRSDADNNSGDDTKYFSEDEILPYDEDKIRLQSSSLLNSDVDEDEDTITPSNTKKSNSKKNSCDSEGFSFLQVVLDDEANSLNTTVLDMISFIGKAGNPETLSPVPKHCLLQKQQADLANQESSSENLPKKSVLELSSSAKSTMSLNEFPRVYVVEDTIDL